MRRPAAYRWIAALLLCLAAETGFALQSGKPPDTAEDWNLESLMATLAGQAGGEARFTEIKTLSSLKQPLVAEGILRFRQPAMLEKEVHKPRAERYLVNGDSMEIYRDGKLKRQVSLDGYPALQNFFGAFIATMGGNLEALRKLYELRLEGTPADWTLQMIPIDTELQRVMKHITVRGEGDAIRSFETIQPNDDRSLMLITPLG